jgi:4-hydroxy-tetrahydrodipicolinate synthase
LGQRQRTLRYPKTKKELVIKTVVDCNDGRLPLVLGVGGNDTRKMLKNYKLGIFLLYCILSVSPFYNKPTQEGIYQHFKAISSFANSDYNL